MAEIFDGPHMLPSLYESEGGMEAWHEACDNLSIPPPPKNEEEDMIVAGKKVEPMPDSYKEEFEKDVVFRILWKCMN